jgi:hypothetical protein
MKYHLGFLLACTIFPAMAGAESRPVLNDPLRGSTVGEQAGGGLTPDGYQPTTGDGHLLYRLPAWPAQGTLEVEVQGMIPATAGDHAFLALYDGRGITEPATYFADFRENFFRFNLHWRVERQAIKAVVNCASPTPPRLTASRAVFTANEKRDFAAEPTGQSVAWDPARWHRLRLDWSPAHLAVSVDGTEVWLVSTPFPYAPVEPRLWLGCAPGHGDKYRNHLPKIIYRNLCITETTP